jgi:hypothetical protein
MVGRGLKSYDPVDVLFGVNENKFKRMLMVHIKLNARKLFRFRREPFLKPKIFQKVLIHTPLKVNLSLVSLRHGCNGGIVIQILNLHHYVEVSGQLHAPAVLSKEK